MRLFATRVWGNPIDGKTPMATFGTEGHMARLLAISSPGDRLVFVGTKTERTPPELQGRILGMAEFGRLRLRTLDYFTKAELDPRDFDARGSFKFPHGVPIVRGWVFTSQAMANDVLNQRLTMLATPGVEELTNPNDIAKILGMPSDYFEPPQNHRFDQMRRINDALKPTTGPIPSNSTYEVEKSAMETSWTYAMRFGTTKIWKVGHTSSVPGRLDEINKHVPFEIGIAKWNITLTQKWPDAVTAHAMEQKLFELLDAKRTTGERVNCTENELLSAWQRAVAGE
ncbi:hypothetical protein E0H68_03765 [Rhizobium leguminosarum bv. viciae]|uniref:hypothetical protein n=1 Tax=Rhizobium leguminosarum TaxID=384 RepID=UPI00103D927D|nr:hypothetical protein [Rhizobium leguminosarum]TCA18562.1 hypothetical protein E0H68_03765 [Rhizobium leguminosarum bv. viciae]